MNYLGGMMALPLAAIFSFGSTILEKIFPDPAKRAEAQLRLNELEQNGELAKIASATSVVVAEAKSEHWLTANWRPITMLTFVFIIANNYILYPYLSLFFDEAPMLAIPPDMWDLLKIGLGGYIVGRSTEKTVEAWKAK